MGGCSFIQYNICFLYSQIYSLLFQSHQSTHQNKILSCVPDSGTTLFQSLPVPRPSLHIGFRYNLLPIVARSRFLSSYRIPVQLSSDCCLFSDSLCVPDSGTTFFRLLPIPRSPLRTGFRYNFLPIVAYSQILFAYRIPVQLSSDRCPFPDSPCVPDSGTTCFRSPPVS